MPALPALIDNPDREYTTAAGVTIRFAPRRYVLTRRHMFATRQDDGIIDPVAVADWCDDHTRHPAISPREAICVVAELAGRGMSDPDIADRTGGHTSGILALRLANHIAPGVPQPGSDGVGWRNFRTDRRANDIAA